MNTESDQKLQEAFKAQILTFETNVQLIMSKIETLKQASTFHAEVKTKLQELNCTLL